MLSPYTKIESVPFRGGVITSIHKSLLPFGGFSSAQNIRNDHPGIRKRPGQIALHTVADSTNSAISLYQFRKRRIDEKHFFAQMSDGDILEATNDPPAVTTGAFGTEVYSGSAGQIPASWSSIDDILIMSNGVDQHQTYAGDDNYVEAAILYKGPVTATGVPERGLDYTQEATDGLTTTSVILDNMLPDGDWASATAANTNYWMRVAWNGSVFAAVALNGTTDSVMTSPDGVTWTERVSTPSGNQWVDIAWAESISLFAAVANTGAGNRVMTSPDGTTWTSRAAASALQWRSVCWSEDLTLFCAVAVDAGATSVMTSPDGITWTTRTPAQNLAWWGVAYGNGLFVAVASSGTDRVMTSPDGITWTTRTPAQDLAWKAITFGNGLFVAVADSGTNRIMTSPDGINWTTRVSPYDLTWRSIAYGNGMYVALAADGSISNDIAYSFDGIKWFADTAPEDNQWRGITYGADRWVGVSGGGTYRVLTKTDNHALFIMTPVPASKLTFTVGAANGTAATGTLYYRKNDNTWADTSETDGTILSSATMGQTGSMTWTAPTDEIPSFMFGQSGYWYKWVTDTQLDSEVEITKITYGSSFVDLTNVWDGVIPYAIEAMYFDRSTDSYLTYASGSIDLNDMVAETGDDYDNQDRLYFNSADQIEGIYIDVGVTPNQNTTAVIKGVKVWTGESFESVGVISDGTNGLTNSGWITWPRVTGAQQTQFKSVQYYSYWYYLWIGTADLSTTVNVAILTMPYFDIEELGKGQCNTIWKERPVTSYTLYPNYIYIGEEGRANNLNGDEFGVLTAGDGRRNKIVAMRKFHNEMVAWQEEKGIEGGTVTLFQGHSRVTFGKLLISSKIGTMNNNCVAVVDGVLTATKTDEKIKDLIFFLSRYGVCVTDGISVSIISDDIQNYFDPTKTECIRRGYEDQMWLTHDTAFNVIRIGLVSGTSATTPNIFPVFDLVDKTWSFDVLGQNLRCATEVEAGSGNLPISQVGAGIGDGLIYLLNATTVHNAGMPADVSTAIDSFVTIELNARAEYIQLLEMLLRCEVKAAGDITLTFTKNEIAAGTKTLTMTAENATQTIRRHLFNLNICDQNISIKIQNNAAGVEMDLLDIGLKSDLFTGR